MMQYNKAIVALIMAILNIANLVWPGKIGIDETTVAIVVNAILPILIYFIPNKTKSP